MGSKKFVRIPFRKEAQSVNRIVSKLEGGERQFYTLSIILAFTSQRRYAVLESPFFFPKKNPKHKITKGGFCSHFTVSLIEKKKKKKDSTFTRCGIYWREPKTGKLKAGLKEGSMVVKCY